LDDPAQRCDSHNRPGAARALKRRISSWAFTGTDRLAQGWNGGRHGVVPGPKRQTAERSRHRSHTSAIRPPMTREPEHPYVDAMPAHLGRQRKQSPSAASVAELHGRRRHRGRGNVSHNVRSVPLIAPPFAPVLHPDGSFRMAPCADA
jgi:hypothetical protein